MSGLYFCRRSGDVSVDGKVALTSQFIDVRLSQLTWIRRFVVKGAIDDYNQTNVGLSRYSPGNLLYRKSRTRGIIRPVG